MAAVVATGVGGVEVCVVGAGNVVVVGGTDGVVMGASVEGDHVVDGVAAGAFVDVGFCSVVVAARVVRASVVVRSVLMVAAAVVC